jgi:CelD/BcsL family acetyltransferase involved in cellulose biosynthesis
MSSAAPIVGDSRRSTATVVSVDRGGIEVVDHWADEWRNLCNAFADDQPFYRPEWIVAHIRAFTPKAKIVLFRVSVEGRLCLVLPLLEERALFCGLPVKRLRAPVNGHSCRFDGVRRSGPAGDLAVQALWEHLKSLPGWDLLEFGGVPADGTVSALALAAELDGFLTGQVPMSPNPYVPIPSDSSSLGKLPLNGRLRTQLRSIRRSLGGGRRLELRRTSNADRVVLQQFYRLEAAGWKGVERTAIACSAQSLQFYDRIAQSAEKFGWLCLYLLELDGQPVAGHFGLSYKGRYFSPKVAYDENCKQWAPGHLMVEEILRDCAARGVQEYDITGQNDLWKRKWTDHTRGQCVQFIFSKGVSGRSAHWVRFRVRRTLKGIVSLAHSVGRFGSATGNRTRFED